jgi:hypothetical protein
MRLALKTRLIASIAAGLAWGQISRAAPPAAGRGPQTSHLSARPQQGRVQLSMPGAGLAATVSP